MISSSTRSSSKRQDINYLCRILVINDDFNYDRVKSLSNEARHKLGKVKPKTLGQASRISGVSPADISVLMIYLGRG
jgi:tRNA uridine 5-carboxymethylaminomethyl modification enzyme